MARLNVIGVESIHGLRTIELVLGDIASFFGAIIRDNIFCFSSFGYFTSISSSSPEFHCP